MFTAASAVIRLASSDSASVTSSTAARICTAWRAPSRRARGPPLRTPAAMSAIVRPRCAEQDAGIVSSVAARTSR